MYHIFLLLITAIDTLTLYGDEFSNLSHNVCSCVAKHKVNKKNLKIETHNSSSWLPELCYRRSNRIYICE